MSYPGPYDGSQQPDWQNYSQPTPESPTAYQPPTDFSGSNYPAPYVPPAGMYQPAPQYPPVQYPAAQYPGPQYGQPAYGVPGIGYDPSAPYGRDPFSGEPLSDKSKVAAGLLQLFVGGFGVGRFYLGHNGIAVAQLVTLILGWILTVVLIGWLVLLGLGVWVLIDGIMILSGGVRDSRGFKLRN